METAYDWITMAIFAGLVLVFLQRSTGDQEPGDTIWHYLPPAIGCMIANYVGNDKSGGISGAIGETGRHLVALGVVAAVLAYIYYVLRPFRHQPRP